MRPVKQQDNLNQQMASFRGVLEDCHKILIGLGDRCLDVEELTELVSLALTNDGQLTILYDLLVPEEKK